MMNKISSFSGSNRFLSNFYLFPFQWQGIIWPSAENAYQASKCENPDDFDKFVALSPTEAKKKGKKIDLRKDWNVETRMEMMESIVETKFSYPEMRRLLDATGDCYIEEGNSWGDRFWGVCDGHGENRLGKILMNVRSKKPKDVPVHFF